MIDIIIPVYNSHCTIIKALSSIAIQTIKDKINVYIIDDFSDCNYDDELSLFNDKINITYIKNSKNMGPGAARQIGIDSSKGKYIIFLDSDDQLFNCYSVEFLYNAIEKDMLDVVMGYFFIEEKENTFLTSEANIYGCLHGKIYKRSHIVKNNIKFNNTRYSEDNSFNTLALVTTSKVSLINNIVYVYKNNVNSLTNDSKMILKINCSYLYNMLWVINILEKKNIDRNIRIDILLNAYIYIFIVVMHNNKIKFNKLYKYCYMFEEKYKEYENLISDDQLFEHLTNRINCDVLMKKEILNKFKNFRKKFKK